MGGHSCAACEQFSVVKASRSTKNMSSPTPSSVEELEVWVVEEFEVLVRSMKGKKIGTILQLISPMIHDASQIYENLYKVKEGDTVKIVFKFDEDISQGEGSEKEGGARKLQRKERMRFQFCVLTNTHT